MRKVLEYLTGEVYLRKRPNSGNLIALRSLQVTAIVYVLSTVLRAGLSPGSTWSADDVQKLLVETMPWFAALFAGVYAALYARFSSQWTYLAELHNQIMSAAVHAETDHARDAIARWQAGFIEDAEELHLATKPMFASVIRFLLSKPEVKAHYIEWTAGGEPRLQALEDAVNKAYSEAEREQANRHGRAVRVAHVSGDEGSSLNDQKE